MAASILTVRAVLRVARTKPDPAAWLSELQAELVASALSGTGLLTQSSIGAKSFGFAFPPGTSPSDAAETIEQALAWLALDSNACPTSSAVARFS